MLVRAVVKLTSGYVGPELGEVVCDFGSFQVNHAQLFDAWRVDEAHAGFWFVHLREGGGMFAFLAEVAELASAQAQGRVKAVEQGAFAHARKSTKEAQFAGKQRPELSKSIAIYGRAAVNGITGLAVHRGKVVVNGSELLVPQITFIENHAHGYIVGFGGYQKAVEKTERYLRVKQGSYEHGLIDIGSQYVGLFTQIGRSPYQMVAPLVDALNHIPMVGMVAEVNHIAHGYRIGGLAAFEA